MIKTPLDLIFYIDKHVPNRVTSSSKTLSLVSANPDMIEWAVNHHRIHRSQDRLLEEKKLSANPNLNIIQNLKASEIDYFYLSTNSHPYAVKLIEQYPRDIWYSMLCQNTNPNAVKIIEGLYIDGYIQQSDIFYNPYAKPHRMDAVNFGTLAANPSAIDFVLTELIHYLFSVDPTHRMIWIGLSKNPHPKAISLLKRYWQRADLRELASNPNIDAIRLLADLVPDYKKWDWNKLSANPAAIPYLKRYPEMIRFRFLGANPHRWAIHKFAKWYVKNKNKRAFEYMLEHNYKDKYLHQFVDFSD